MTDRVLVPLPDGRWLALSADVFQNALTEGARLSCSQDPSGTTQGHAEPLVDADKAAEQLHVSARWLEDSARAGLIPHHKLGRYIRFRVSDIATHTQSIDPNPSSRGTPSVRRN